jgi:hypothetical protein
MVNVIVHCSDSSFGNAALITKWHVTERKWVTIGYHYVILNGWLSSSKYHSYFDGHLETGRPLDDDKDIEWDEMGAHAAGWNMSVGICLIGLSGAFTDAQLRALSDLIKMLRYQFKEIKVIQHSDVEPKKPHCAGLTKMQLHVLNTV